MSYKEPYKKIIIFLSVSIPILVAVLFRIKIEGVDLPFLPPVYAAVNALTAILLLLSLGAIKAGKRKIHEILMKTCIVLSASFLVMYVVHHITSDSTTFGGEGGVRYVYFFLLITHIVLSVMVIPLVLFTFGRALSKNFEKHKTLARLAFPVWLYVAVTGVVVYYMIRPYY